MSIVTLTTDFGDGSPYVAAMKGVLLSINPAVTLVDITHNVRPQDVRQGALFLEDVTVRFPPGTIHVAVVDPGVGTDRAVVYAEIGPQRYVAPDNGLLSRLTRRTTPSRLIRLAEPSHWLQPVSATFHGRDIMAPAAARLSLGLEPSRLGPALETLVSLDWPEPQVMAERIEGEVLDVDSFGNLSTTITDELLASNSAGRQAVVVCKGRRIEGLLRTYGEGRSGELIALVGSSGRLELAVVGGNAAAMLETGVGQRVLVQWT